MGKLFLVLLLALGVALYVPSSRAVIFEKAKPVIDPYLVMATRSEMEKVMQDLLLHERDNFGRLPDRRDFDDWMDRKYTGGASLDSWGTHYEYSFTRDSIFLRSFGPDRTRASEDDIVEARIRAAGRRR